MTTIKTLISLAHTDQGSRIQRYKNPINMQYTNENSLQHQLTDISAMKPRSKADETAPSQKDHHNIKNKSTDLNKINEQRRDKLIRRSHQPEETATEPQNPSSQGLEDPVVWNYAQNHKHPEKQLHSTNKQILELHSHILKNQLFTP